MGLALYLARVRSNEVLGGMLRKLSLVVDETSAIWKPTAQRARKRLI
jgi:hypothetical protein